MKRETIALHAGYQSEPTTKSAAVPIYQTTSYTFDNTQHGADLFNLDVAGNIYTRIMNPTTAVLEERVARLEGGIAALAVASGMAAITYAVQTLVEAGNNIIATKTHIQFLCPQPAAPRHRSAPYRSCQTRRNRRQYRQPNQTGVLRIYRQSRHQCRRYSGIRPSRTRSRAATDGGQHRRYAHAVPPHRTRCRHRYPILD